MDKNKNKDTVFLEQDKKMFLEDLKKGKISIADIETTKEGTIYYYIQNIT